jgi:flagellar basal body rod protein FlgB
MMFGLDLGDSVSLLSAISARQQVNANNVANLSTPGYTSKRLDFAELLSNLGEGPFQTSLSQKLSSAHSMASDTGETVNLPQEFIEMQRNYLYYSAVARRLSTHINGLKQAMQIGR